MTENEDADPVGAADPVEVYTALAAEHGLIQPGDELDQNMVDFAAAVVQRCAKIADAYGDGEAGGNAGEHIKAELLPH